jgi:hypothetical protein
MHTDSSNHQRAWTKQLDSGLADCGIFLSRLPSSFYFFIPGENSTFDSKHSAVLKPLAQSVQLVSAVLFLLGDLMRTKTAGEQEGEYTGAIETQTSKIPSGVYLTAAIGSMAASAILKISGQDDWSHFVGHWAPAFLMLGVYNKLVKQNGSDASSRRLKPQPSAAAAD